MHLRPFSPRRWWIAAGASLVLVLLLAPWVYRLLVHLDWVDTSDIVGGDPYAKVVRRMLFLPIAIMVLGALRPWRDVGPAEMGLVGPRARPRAGLLAFGLTVGAIAALLLVHGLLGWLVLELDGSPGRALRRLGKTLLSGVVIACLEEWIFRAWLPVRFARRLSPRAAVATSIALYAVLHAFRATRVKGPIEVSTGGALEALGLWLGTLLNPAVFAPTFLGLALFGTLLLALYRRTRTLWAPIGVHAAAVWVLFAYGGLTERDGTPAWAGTKVLYDGPLGWALLLLALWGVLRWGRRGNAAAAPLQ